MRFGVRKPESMWPRAWLLPAVTAALAGAIFARPYVPRVITGGVGRTLRYIGEAETYNRTVIASNYFNDGFVRRGLGGTIAVLLSPHWNGSIWLFITLSFAALIVPLAVIVRKLAATLSARQATYLALIFSLSPQTFFGWSRDPSRTDLLVGACLAFTLLAWLRGNKLIAVALVLVGLLAHETAVVYGLPLLVAIAATELRSGALHRDEAIRLCLFGLLGIAAIIFLQVTWSAPSEVTARNMLEQAPSFADDPKHRLWRDIAIYMAVGGSRALNTALCYNMHMSSRYWPEFFGSLAVLAVYSVILPLRRDLLLAFLVMWVPTIFMMLVANDTGRWLKLGVLNGWLIASFLLLRGAAAAQLTDRSMKVGAVLFCALLAMGTTAHNNVNDAYGSLLLRLGYQDHSALDVWMNTCDPGWRSVVYGSPTRPPRVIVR